MKGNPAIFTAAMHLDQLKQAQHELIVADLKEKFIYQIDETRFNSQDCKRKAFSNMN